MRRFVQGRAEKRGRVSAAHVQIGRRQGVASQVPPADVRVAGWDAGGEERCAAAATGGE